MPTSKELGTTFRLVDRTSRELAPIRQAYQQVAAATDEASRAGRAFAAVQASVNEALRKQGVSERLSGQLAREAAQAQVEGARRNQVAQALIAANFSRGQAQKIANQSTAEPPGILSRIGLTGEGPARTIAALAGVGLGLNVAATAAQRVHDAIAAAFERSVEFGKSLSEVRAVSGATAVQMEQVARQALSISRAFGVGATEVVRGVGALVKAGVSVQDALNGATEASITLARAGGIDLPQAAEIAATALNTFSLSAKDLPRVADLVAGAANASAIEVDDVRQSLSQAAAVARTTGISFDDLTRAISLLGTQGLRGSDAGTSLRTLLLRLEPESAAAADAMRSLGIITADGGNKFFDASGKVKSFADIAEVLKQSTAGLTQQQKTLALTTAFGTDSIRAAAILARSGADGFNSLAASMDKVRAIDVAKIRMDNLAGDLDRARASADALLLALGQASQGQFRIPVQLAIAGLDFAAGGAQEAAAAKAEADDVRKQIAEQMRAGFEMNGFTGPVGDAVRTWLAGEMAKTPITRAPFNITTREQQLAVSASEQALRQHAAEVTAGTPFDPQAAAQGRAIAELTRRRTVDESKVADLERARAVLGRENTDLALREAQARLRLLPIQQEMADIQREITIGQNRGLQLTREEAVLRAQQRANPANDALSDIQTQERRLQLVIATTRGAERSAARRELRGLLRGRVEQRAELAALDANQPLTVAQRAQRDTALTIQIANIPNLIKQAKLEIDAGPLEAAVAAIQAQQQEEAAGRAALFATLDGQLAELTTHIGILNNLITKPYIPGADRNANGGFVDLTGNYVGRLTVEVKTDGVRTDLYEEMIQAQQRARMPAYAGEAGS